MGRINPIRFEIRKKSIATVDKSGYVRLREDVHHYSVPYTYIGKKLTISYTNTDVFIYDRYILVTTHKRDRANYKFTKKAEHLCPKHQAMTEWEPEKIIEEASRIHDIVEFYIRKIIELKRYPEAAVKNCSGVLNFARKVGHDRLIAACRLAHSYERYSFSEIEDILVNNRDSIELPEEIADIAEHENIRGKEYYE